MSTIQDLITISKYAGMREDLVQAGGGNSSVKLGANKMLIKASGFQLAEVTADKGYAVVDQSIICDYFDITSMEQIGQNAEKMLLEKSLLEGSRPSIETFLHAITGAVTLHTHPTVVNVVTSRNDWTSILEKMFPKALLVNYATPGINLAKEYFSAYKKAANNKSQNSFNVIFLKNHGLIVSADNANDVIRMTESIVQKLASYLKIDTTPYSNVTLIYELLQNAMDIERDILHLVKDFHVYEAYQKIGHWNHCFCPDCIVYCGKRVLMLSENSEKEQINHDMQEFGKPVIIFYKGYFYVLASNKRKAQEIESILSFGAQVNLHNADVAMEFLPESEQDFLLNWDSEKYRKNLKE